MEGTINIDGDHIWFFGVHDLIVVDFVIGRPDFMVFLVKVLHQIKYQPQAKDRDDGVLLFTG